REYPPPSRRRAHTGSRRYYPALPAWRFLSYEGRGDGIRQGDHAPGRLLVERRGQDQAETLRLRIDPHPRAGRASVAEALPSEQVSPTARRAGVVEPPAQAPRLRSTDRFGQVGKIMEAVARHHLDGRRRQQTHVLPASP